MWTWAMAHPYLFTIIAVWVAGCFAEGLGNLKRRK